MVGFCVVPDAGFLGEVLFHKIQNGHLPTPGNDGVHNVPTDLLLLFLQGKPSPFDLGRAVRGFRLPTVNKLGLSGGVDVFVRILSVFALALSAAKNAVLAVTSLFAYVYAPFCEKSLGTNNHIIP